MVRTRTRRRHCRKKALCRSEEEARMSGINNKSYEYVCLVAVRGLKFVTSLMPKSPFLRLMVCISLLEGCSRNANMWHGLYCEMYRILRVLRGLVIGTTCLDIPSIPKPWKEVSAPSLACDRPSIFIPAISRFYSSIRSSIVSSDGDRAIPRSAPFSN
jgi:hypothetical protein